MKISPKPLLIVLAALALFCWAADSDAQRRQRRTNPFERVPGMLDEDYEDMMRDPATMLEPGERIPLEGAVDRDEYLLGPGDHLDVTVWGMDPVENNVLWVSGEGRLLLPPVGVVQVDGLSLNQAEAKVTELMKDYYAAEVKVTLSLINPRTFRVYAAGAVLYPGAYRMTPLDRVNDLIQLAGGIKQGGSRRNVMVFDNDRRLLHQTDLFRYFANGRLEHNPQLVDGAIVEVPGIRNYVMFNGRFPHLHGLDSLRARTNLLEPETSFPVEFLPGETLADLLELTGMPQMPDTALVGNVKVSSDVPTRQGVRLLTADMLNRPVSAGEYYEFPVRSNWVYVTGSTNQHGRFQYTPGWTVQDYLGQAGGPNWNGDSDKIILRRADGAEIEASRQETVYPGDMIFIPEKLHVERYLAVAAGVVSALIVVLFN